MEIDLFGGINVCIVSRRVMPNVVLQGSNMNKCPNDSYNGIECPYALFEDSPLPCFGSQEQCDKYRKQIEKPNDQH